MNRSQALCSLFFALYTLPASAIVDANNNGMSDLWEQQFNAGELFAESFVAQDDADSDGWTNEQEATAGTDPLEAKPPIGILCPELTYSNDVWLDLNGDGANEFYPAIVTIKWPMIAGKLYTLLFSPDLNQESWMTVDRAPSEIDAERTCYVPLTQPEGGIPDKCFWRVRVEDADTDGDGLTDAEELQIGSSRFLADTDGDRSGDFNEVSSGTNPLVRDTDGDAVMDGDEVQMGLNPLLLEDLDNDGMPDDWERFMSASLLEIFPDSAYWGTRYADLVAGDLNSAISYTSDGISAGDVCAVMVGTEDAGNGDGIEFEWLEKEESFIGTYDSANEEYPYRGTGYSSSSEWSRNSLVTEYDDGSAFSSAALLSRLSSLAWAPVSVRDKSGGDYKPMFSVFPFEFEAERVGTSSPHAYANYFSFAVSDTVTGTNGRKKSFRVRLASRRPAREAVTASWLRIKYTGQSNNAINPNLIQDISAEEMTIEKGGAFSTWVAVETALPSGSQGAESGNNEALIPAVEVIDANKTAVTKLKVGKMSDTGVLSGAEPSTTLDIDKDADLFYVRVPGAAAMGPASIKLATADNPTATYNDDETEIDLQVEGNDLISKSMLLVSDDVDDDYKMDGVADDARNDRTHKIQLGGNVKICSLAIGGKNIPLNVKVKVPYRKILRGRIVLVGSAADDSLAIANLRDIAAERDAQTGVKLEMPITTMAVPEGVDEYNVHEDGGVADGGSLVPDDMIKIINKATLEEKRGKITVFVVPNVVGLYLGRSYTKRFTATIHAAYALNAVVSAEDVLKGANIMKFTIGHEIGHLLTNNEHFPYSELNHSLVEISHNLMREGTSPSDSLGASKRYLQSQEDMFLKELLSDP